MQVDARLAADGITPSWTAGPARNPFANETESRADTVARLRRVADDLEQAPRRHVADVIVWIADALADLERSTELLLRRGEGPTHEPSEV